jgi:acyl carrier protein
MQSTSTAVAPSQQAHESGAEKDVGRDIEQCVREYLGKMFLLRGDGGGDLSSDDSFLELGLIDSTGVLELISFLETTFGIAIADEELTPDNLDSVARIVAYVRRKLA